MMEHPHSSRSAGDSALTVACVPTGIKTGVSTTECAVRRTPARAPEAESARTSSKKLSSLLSFITNNPRSADVIVDIDFAFRYLLIGAVHAFTMAAKKTQGEKLASETKTRIVMCRSKCRHSTVNVQLLTRLLYAPWCVDPCLLILKYVSPHGPHSLN